MGKRFAALLFLIAGVCTLPAQTAHAAPATLAIAISGTGPFAPGTIISVALTGGAPGADVQIEQCAADGHVCASGTSGTLDGSGALTSAFRVHRRIGEPTAALDCAHVACVVRADTFGDTSETASAPISIDASAPVVAPVLTTDATTPLPDRARIRAHGSGFDPSSYVPIWQCVGSDTSTCLEAESGYGETDASGTLDGLVWVTRVVRGRDCAAPGNSCKLWALPYGNLDDRVAVALTFDGTSPPVLPHATVTPTSALRHEQSVTISGTDFLPDGYAQIEQCSAQGPADQRCRYLANAQVGSDGSFTTTASISRRVRLDDSAVVACVVRIWVYPVDQIDVPIAFDASEPPPPVPSVTVAPDANLVDRQIVQVQMHGAEPGAFAVLTVCTAEGSTCRGDVSENVATADAVIAMSLPRILAPGVDCAVVACEVRASVYGTDAYDFEIPVSFDPDAPLAEGAAVSVAPARGLWDRQGLEVRGARFDPGTEATVRQCVSSDAAPGTCGEPLVVRANSSGLISARYSVRRVLEIAGTAHDCAATACFLVISGEPATAVALEFDPAGPTRGSDLPRQPSCVAWPTNGWPTGPLPAGVDPAAVEAAAAQTVGPNGGDSVVVIHGGQLVYEKYAAGVTADSILSSFSMSKSFTSTVVGLLVDEGRLDLDACAPIAEWAGANDPRRAITLRNILNMSSGLEWNEDYVDAAVSDVFKMVAASDEAGYVFQKTLAHAPGTYWNYSTGDTAVLGRIIGQTAGVSGTTYSTFLHQRLLDPLGINPVDLGFDGTGTWRAGWQTNSTTRNFAKLGLLYLRDGVWEGSQFLSSDWVDFVRAPSPAYEGYGGQFWLNGDGTFSMIGYGGQEVHIVPQLDLIVAVNGGGGTDRMVEAFRNVKPLVCGVPAAAVDDNADARPLESVDVDVLANDAGGDVGLAPSTLTITSAPTQGTAEIAGNTVRYHAGGDFTGTDTFGYVVCTNDRQQCVEATVHVHARVAPLPFRFLSPNRSGENVRTPGRSVVIKFQTPRGEMAVDAITSIAVDCTTGEPLGEHEPVDADLHANPRLGVVTFVWRTTPTWTGCRDLEVATTDGQVHAARFHWQPRRMFGERPPPGTLQWTHHRASCWGGHARHPR